MLKCILVNGNQNFRKSFVRNFNINLSKKFFFINANDDKTDRYFDIENVDTF